MILSKYLDYVDRSVVSSFKPYLPESLCRPLPLVLATTVGAISVYLIWKKCTSRAMPPSPRGWPIVGNMLDISEDNIHQDFIRMQERDKLPDIFTVRLGPMYSMIVLNSYDAIKDCFLTHANVFSERTPSLAFEIMDNKDETFSIPYADPRWRELKSFLVSALRTVGFGNSKSSEEKILNQVDMLIEKLKPAADAGDAIDPSLLLQFAAANVIFGTLSSKVYSPDDAELKERVQILQDWYTTFMDFFVLEMMPNRLARFIMGSKKKKLLECTDQLRAFIRQDVIEHQATVDAENPRDFIDVYLTRKTGPIDVDSLVDTVMFFMPDSVDSVASFIGWILLYVTTFPDAMRKAQSEIEAVTSGNRRVVLSDRGKLPYTEAVIMEAIRVACPFTMTGFHTVKTDYCYRGYNIPKNTGIIANLYAALRNPDVFHDPEEFKPERFLDKDGKLRHQEYWITFGMGPRKCLGEQLSKAEMFLFTANILQEFDLSFPSDDPKPSLEPQKSSQRHPQPYKLLLKARN